MTEGPKRPSLTARAITAVQAVPALQGRRAIPVHKRRGQWLNTLVGGSVFVGAFALPKFLGFPWQVAVAVAGFGAFIASKGLVLDYVKALPQAIGAILGAVRGGTS